jgi:uncharacterized protein DUF6265
MKTRTIYTALAVIFVVIATAIGNHTHSAATTSDIAQLAWMSGDWQTASGGRAQIEEHWTQPAGRSMLGMGRTVAGGKTAEFEFLRIEQRDDAVYYVAQPKGQCPPTDFKLTRATGQEAVFENLAHDFPKRIIYKKTGEDSLTASIDGGEGTKQMTFAYRRMK